MLGANFWQDKSDSQKTIKEKKLFEDLVNSFKDSATQLKDLDDLYTLATDEKNLNVKKEVIENDSSEKFIFKMKRTLISDIYKLYCKSNDIIIFHSNACVPNLKSSHNISRFFKDKKLEFDNVNINYENEGEKYPIYFTRDGLKWKITNIEFPKDLFEKIK